MSFTSSPSWGSVPVEEIDARDIRDTLAPLWHTKADTARKALNRIGIVLKHGAAMGLDVDLQATEKAKALLGRTRHRAQNVPAVAWMDVPAFYASLDERTVTHLALRLLILTGVRSAPLAVSQAGADRRGRVDHSGREHEGPKGRDR